MAKGKKTGGRQVGTPNRVNGKVNEMLSERGINLIDEILKDLAAMDSAERAGIWLKLMEYAFPKLKSIDHKVSVDKLPDSELKPLWLEAQKIAAEKFTKDDTTDGEE